MGSTVLFIVSRTPRTEKLRHSVILALSLQVPEFFDKIPGKKLLDVLFPVFRFFLIVFYSNVFRIKKVN